MGPRSRQHTVHCMPRDAHIWKRLHDGKGPRQNRRQKHEDRALVNNRVTCGRRIIPRGSSGAMQTGVVPCCLGAVIQARPSARGNIGCWDWGTRNRSDFPRQPVQEQPWDLEPRPFPLEDETLHQLQPIKSCSLLPEVSNVCKRTGDTPKETRRDRTRKELQYL